VPLTERVECIRSMYVVFNGFVAKSKVEVMENCFLYVVGISGEFALVSSFVPKTRF